MLRSLCTISLVVSAPGCLPHRAPHRAPDALWQHTAAGDLHPLPSPDAVVVEVDRALGLAPTARLEDGVPIAQLQPAVFPAGGSVWRWPVSGTVSSPYGPRWGRLHGGLDVAAAVGTPVFAARTGRVVVAEQTGDFGLLIELDHGDGWRSRYGHLSAVTVQPGQQLQAGALLGAVGQTGNATGPHLHFEVRHEGTSFDPVCVVQGDCLAATAQASR